MKKIFEIIEKIRNRPHHEKGRFAFLSAFVITLIIFFIWVSALGLRDDLGGKEAMAEVGRAGSPFKDLRNIFSGFMDSLPDAKEVFDAGPIEIKGTSSTGF